ncbi:3-ketoacyl-ACP reductase [Roseibium sp. RKSG952]|uniref:3-ketoacyl-ACP reductase n=1 Tax=Roseibium sp. RKSG952 TaxID=2529384 RepID=UPI0012BD7BF8|nr:3-ketoacyl-ACP reductase [Roseibium sp. RKSG952]MTH99060.1 3-ketoacyl-ACP reductase [Roseibium sp. RKSG952]
MARVALVTGGQQGIGLGIAGALISRKFKVAIASELDRADSKVSEALKRLGSQAAYYQHDLRHITHIGTLLNAIETDLGPVTSLVANAGVPAKVRGDMLDIGEDSFDFVLDINLKGSFFLAQAVAKRMLAQENPPYRSISFITSVSAETVSVERAEYCLSKAAGSMMSKLFAARLAAANIGVFEIRPGIIETGMTAPVKAKYDGLIEGGLVPAERWGLPADVGAMIVPLVEGQFAFATGAVIPVDGGLSIQRL